MSLEEASTNVSLYNEVGSTLDFSNLPQPSDSTRQLKDSTSSQSKNSESYKSVDSRKDSHKSKDSRKDSHKSVDSHRSSESSGSTIDFSSLPCTSLPDDSDTESSTASNEDDVISEGNISADTASINSAWSVTDSSNENGDKKSCHGAYCKNYNDFSLKRSTGNDRLQSLTQNLRKSTGLGYEGHQEGHEEEHEEDHSDDHSQFSDDGSQREHEGQRGRRHHKDHHHDHLKVQTLDVNEDAVVRGTLHANHVDQDSAYVEGSAGLDGHITKWKLERGDGVDVIYVNPIHGQVHIQLGSSTDPYFERNRTITIKDVTPEFAIGASHNIYISVPPTKLEYPTRIEHYANCTNGTCVIASNDGAYALNSGGGAVTFRYMNSPIPGSLPTWVIQNQFIGNPRLLTSTGITFVPASCTNRQRVINGH